MKWWQSALILAVVIAGGAALITIATVLGVHP